MSWRQVAETRPLLAEERGTVYKDWGGRLPIALLFPNTYHLGMSSLAVHSLYRLWNACEDVVCERVFVTPSRTGRPGPNEIMPLSLESGAPLDFFPVIACTVSYELDYFQVITALRAAGIPPRASDRDERHPLILAGGPALSANPEPMSPFLDAIVIGEVEPIFDSLTHALHSSADRTQALHELAALPGVYLPGLSAPTLPGVVHAPGLQPTAVTRQWLRNLDAYPTSSAILTPNTEFANMGLIEIARGCGRGCRFCLAGYAYRPPRQRSVESILDQARELLNFTDRLGLVSAAVSDHTQIEELTHELRALGARLSVSSMRVDPASETLIKALAESDIRTLTIAPEAGSERLRRVIHKTQTEAHVLRAVELAAHHGLRQIKLYFMVGLPTEVREDLEALVLLATACAGRFPHRVTVNVTPFVPKAHTRFERVPQAPAHSVRASIAYVERSLRSQGIEVKSESPAWAEIQGTLARGDRRLAEALLRVDAVTPSNWRKALEASDLSLSGLLRERSADEPLPWDFVRYDTPVTPRTQEAGRSAINQNRLSHPKDSDDLFELCS